ncbi:hypothetical protein CKO31_13310 [Thiohalocapsa halophila]|uniref:Uncharacterized protein n=1 Tax=Thiohalocapsa halophila TaxID=69359 RepID=A0ABS1CIQ4_9GAMM|nr:hypothetical protein [Thiohalocapsa halophila]MBK1631707.1 hypothetical protein [Thiohalocapsa halophila]
MDASAPATARGRAAVTAGIADRRRAIGLFLSLEAGACVRLGALDWSGEDPATLAIAEAPSIVAEDAALLNAITQTLAAAPDA